VPVDILVAEWASHPARTWSLAADIVKDLVIGKAPHTPLGTGEEIAALYDVSTAAVSKARMLLARLGIIYKAGSAAYFTSQPLERPLGWHLGSITSP
jgi:DNA-binding GntR family transcriptional regulator